VVEADPRHKVLLVFSMVYHAVVEIAELDVEPAPEPPPDPLPDPLPLEPLDESCGPTTMPLELIFASHVWYSVLSMASVIGFVEID
jgi:hypothetical protein